MNTYSKLRKIAKAARNGASFFHFQYVKESGEVSARTVLLNVNVEKRQEKVGEPLKGKKNWISGNRRHRNGCIVKKDGQFYLSAYDENGTAKYPKVFKINNMKF